MKRIFFITPRGLPENSSYPLSSFWAKANHHLRLKERRALFAVMPGIGPGTLLLPSLRAQARGTYTEQALQCR